MINLFSLQLLLSKFLSPVLTEENQTLEMLCLMASLFCKQKPSTSSWESYTHCPFLIRTLLLPEVGNKQGELDFRTVILSDSHLNLFHLIERPSVFWRSLIIKHTHKYFQSFLKQHIRFQLFSPAIHRKQIRLLVVQSLDKDITDYSF